MSEIRWYDLMNEITKVERKYNIKNPKWDGDWYNVFKDYGFVPVDSKGEWWTRIPEKPNVPIIYAPLAAASATTAGAVEGATATVLIDSVSPVIDVAYTEIAAGEATATVTTAGAVSATSSAVATAAAGAAIGFGVGVGSFELAPEFWTKVSNAVFGTDLDPEEIGQMARDSNALVVIKDGLVYMAQDMIEAIRNAFFDNGAGDSYILPYIPPEEPSGQEVSVEIKSYPVTLPFTKEEFKNFFPEANWETGAAKTVLGYYDAMEKEALNGVFDYNITHEIYPTYERRYLTIHIGSRSYPNSTPNLPYTVKVTSRLDSDGKTYYFGQDGRAQYYANTYDITWRSDRNDFTAYGKAAESKNKNYGLGVRHTTYTAAAEVNQYYYYFWNAVAKSGIDSITPDGTQGSKDQPLAVVFPDWVSKGIETIAGDGKTKIKWLPVSIPNSDPLINGNPFTGDQAREGTFPDNYTDTANKLGEQTEEATKTAPSYPTPPIPSVPGITPTPDDPSLIGGGGSLTGLANLYNPTLNQVKLFSRWLWGSDGLNLDQLKKLLQDPMQAIIGLHVLYATPTTGDERGIQVGYINSGVNSKIVTEQYITVDCGTVTVPEYYGDARDYSPFTQVYCYLPFIGIVELNADDVINSKLSITYKVDVLTGTCLAQLKVKKYSLNAVLYTYTGNAAVQMPITSGSYLSTVASLIGTVGGVIATAATGGALAPVVAGAVSGAIKSNVAMSGSLGANAGAMGIRKPYLIIKRQEQADASGYSAFYGLPTNKRVTLSEITGYCRVKDINLSVAGATEEEQNEITALLKEGVIL